MSITKFSVFDYLQEGIQVIDEHWRYVYVNKAVARQGKTIVSDLIGKSMLDQYPRIEKTEMFSLLKKCMHDRSLQKIVNKFEFADGTEEWFELSIQPVPKGVIILSIDVTDQKLAEKKLTTQYVNSLEQKNQELEQFTGIVSHDLQAPLNTVTSIVEVLRRELGEGRINEAVDLQLSFISKSTQRMRELIRGLLEYSKIGQHIKMKEIESQKLVEDVLEDLAKVIEEKKAKITFENLPSLTGYETELRLLFQNLILNAIKFQKNESTPRVKIGAQRNSGFWKISVSDNGIGIKKKDLDRIFGLFSRLHSQTEFDGSGIGLAHCQKIVKLHHGTISVDSTVGRGSTFYFTIPIKPFILL